MCHLSNSLVCFVRSGGYKNSVVPQQNGPPRRISDPVPNLYKTALELNSSDFYSTFNVDPEQYSKVMQAQPVKRRPMYDSTDNLSASHEDLLASYRDVDNDIASGMTGGQHRRISGLAEIANGRISPEANGLRYELQHSLLL